MRILGVDLGQARDPAAFALGECYESEPSQFIGPRNPRYSERLFTTNLRVWPLNTDYTVLVEDILNVPADVIVIDFGGVGRPTVDLLRQRARYRNFTGKILPVQLIGSSSRATSRHTDRGMHMNIPKIDVVNSLLLLQQSRNLFLPQVPELEILFKQLQDFRMTITKAANLQFGNIPGTGRNDDLVIALGLVCWYKKTFGGRKPTFLL